MWTITDHTARTLSLGDRVDLVKFDGRLRGFGVRVRELKDGTTQRRYLYQYKAHGKHHRMDCGAVRDVTATQARATAQAYADAVRVGRDPAMEKRAFQTEELLTLGHAIPRYLEARAPAMRENTLKQVKPYLERNWKPLHTTALSQITLAHVAAVVDDLERTRGPAAANRCRAALSAFFKWAVSIGAVPSNPVRDCYMATERGPRDRALTAQEAAAVWLAAPDTDFGKIVQLLLLTACRRNEIGELRWEEVDLDARTITLPKERTKNAQKHVVPLTDRAVAILQAQRRRASGVVFGNGARGFGGWSQAKLAMDKSLTIAAWTLHDLRRTVRSAVGRLGVPPHIGEAILNHLPPALVRTYDTNAYEAEKRHALGLWESHLMVAVAQATGANITQLRTA
jgi:integrase